ncbi:MAG TPA: squalene/phytoene synthase family protein [Gammaproteobacteria bacterium]|nr:squalene/phytoene synthase family protein [Gammaproteobacteria bacterium]
MNPADQAAAKVASASIDLRLSLTFLKPEHRATQAALHAVYLELREVPREVRDPGVAEVKLRWWEEEIGALYAGKPRHPLTVALWPHLPPLSGKQQAFLDLITGTRMDIASASFASFEDVKRYCYRHSGALAELSAVLAGAHSDEAQLAARLLGNSTHLADIAVRGTAEALRGRVYFAAEDLKAHGVDRHISGETHADAPVKALVKDYGERARAMQAEALAAIPALERDAFASWRVMGALALKRLAKSERTGSGTNAEPVELHPLSALLTAWRAARRRTP